MAAFATSADMLARYDARSLGDLCSDNGEPVTAAQLAANSKMTTALADATGQMLAACLRGGRYTAADLAGLTDESLSYRNRICCVLAFWNLWDRKPYTSDEARKAAKEEAKEMLEMLRTGEQIFDVAATIAASIPDVDTVTNVEIATWNLLPDQCRHGRYYPRRRTFNNR